MGPKLKSQRVISRDDAREGGEKAEIAVEVTLPVDGGWGWVVVISSFLNICILDGVVYTFGSLLSDVSKDLNLNNSIVTWCNSIAVSMYFLGGPLVSALINRYGFRECAMAGSMVCSFSLLISYFTTTFTALCVFYGFFAGFGYSLINMSSGLVVGFYFERFRFVALAIATCGSSIGVMSFFPLNTVLVSIAGWRATILFHSGLLGLIFFQSMSFRPLLSMKVSRVAEEPTCTVTYLPSLASNVHTMASHSRVRSNRSVLTEELATTATERLFSAISSSHFPTAAKIVEQEDSETETKAGPSSADVSKFTLTASPPSDSTLNTQQIRQIKSIKSKTSPSQIQVVSKTSETHIKHIIKKPKPLSFWKRFFHWESHVPESRPMYRDDAFYKGRLEDLPVYQKSVLEQPKERRTGLEYSLAVSRAATVHDLEEKRGVFTTAARRTLATMMDPSLLRKKSFLLLCSSGFFTYLGFLVPYVYLKDRNIQAGLDPKHCTFLISAIGLSNAFGRLGLGSLASKINPVLLFSFSCIMAGLSTIVSCFSFNLYYQYACCCVFGFFIASVACLRSIILVSLYGLDKLTNATGMILIFLGLGNLASTPIAGLIKNKFGYSIAFTVAGTFITISGMFLIPVKYISQREKKETTAERERLSNKANGTGINSDGLTLNQIKQLPRASRLGGHQKKHKKIRP